jgi:hypothetical protein
VSEGAPALVVAHDVDARSPQSCVGAAQLHTLPMHVCPPVHLLPQAPQLTGSVVVLTHAPLQSVIVAVHAGSHTRSDAAQLACRAHVAAAA